MAAILKRATLRTSLLLDFASEKELVAQTGHGRSAWPLVILKELIDNGIDACEEVGIAPVISVTVDDAGITVEDNGPGIPASTIEGVLDSRSEYQAGKPTCPPPGAHRATHSRQSSPCRSS